MFISATRRSLAKLRGIVLYHFVLAQYFDINILVLAQHHLYVSIRSRLRSLPDACHNDPGYPLEMITRCFAIPPTGAMGLRTRTQYVTVLMLPPKPLLQTLQVYV